MADYGKRKCGHKPAQRSRLAAGALAVLDSERRHPVESTVAKNGGAALRMKAISLWPRYGPNGRP